MQFKLISDHSSTFFFISITHNPNTSFTKFPINKIHRLTFNSLENIRIQSIELPIEWSVCSQCGVQKAISALKSHKEHHHPHQAEAKIRFKSEDLLHLKWNTTSDRSWRKQSSTYQYHMKKSHDDISSTLADHSCLQPEYCVQKKKSKTNHKISFS